MKKCLIGFLAAFLIYGCSLQHHTHLHTKNLYRFDFSEIEDFKEGNSCRYDFLYFFGSYGEDKTFYAIREAKIKKVYLLEEKYDDYFFIQRHCYNVYGK